MSAAIPPRTTTDPFRSIRRAKRHRRDGCLGCRKLFGALGIEHGVERSPLGAALSELGFLLGGAHPLPIDVSMICLRARLSPDNLASWRRITSQSWARGSVATRWR